MSKIKEWIIKKLGGIQNYTLASIHSDIESHVYSCPVTTLEVQIIVNEEVYDKEYILSNMSKSLAKAIIGSKLYSYEETKKPEVNRDAIHCKMRVAVCKIV